jgi:hypothetical protein
MTDGIFLELKNITKGFSGVLALDDVSFSARLGEVHAIYRINWKFIHKTTEELLRSEGLLDNLRIFIYKVFFCAKYLLTCAKFYVTIVKGE